MLECHVSTLANVVNPTAKSGAGDAIIRKARNSQKKQFCGFLGNTVLFKWIIPISVHYFIFMRQHLILIISELIIPWPGLASIARLLGGYCSGGWLGCFFSASICFCKTKRLLPINLVFLLLFEATNRCKLFDSRAPFYPATASKPKLHLTAFMAWYLIHSLRKWRSVA